MIFNNLNFLIILSLCSFSLLGCSQQNEKNVCDFQELSNVLEIVEEAEQKTSEYFNLAQEERQKVKNIYEENKLLLEKLTQERQKLEKVKRDLKKSRNSCGNLSAERLSKITPLQNLSAVKNTKVQNSAKNQKKSEINKEEQKIINPPYSPSDAPL
ncbi:MAG: hypothetical protein LBE20_04775 [Deltaproteobacteria bacterium]|jgi:cell shape-determining protein MreC|nr:hypothetical protein [Deltaproteobacteria bacterium]